MEFGYMVLYTRYAWYVYIYILYAMYYMYILYGYICIRICIKFNPSWVWLLLVIITFPPNSVSLLQCILSRRVYRINSRHIIPEHMSHYPRVSCIYTNPYTRITRPRCSVHHLPEMSTPNPEHKNSGTYSKYPSSVQYMRWLFFFNRNAHFIYHHLLQQK